MERVGGFAGLAQKIVEREIAQREGAEDVGQALESMFRLLEEVMSGMVGELGFRALMGRALQMTHQQAAKRGELAPELAVGFPGERWVDAVARRGAPQALTSATQLLTNVLDLLASFIGDDLTFRLVGRAWKELGGAGSEPGGGQEA